MFARILVLVLVVAVAWAVVARASTAAGPDQVYTVKAGDTLWSIASSRSGATRGVGSGRSSSETVSPVGRWWPAHASSSQSRNLLRECAAPS